MRFLGTVPLDNANGTINAFDIALAPFIAAFNAEIRRAALKIRDYAASARPVVAADIPGLHPFAEAGWLLTHTPDDPHDLAEKIAVLLADPERRERMGKVARAYAQAHFPWRQVAENILAEAEELIEEDR